MRKRPGRPPRPIHATRTYQKQVERAEFWKQRYLDLKEEYDNYLTGKAVVDTPEYDLGWRDGNRAGRISRW